LAEVPLQEATRGKDVILEWLPFELRPEPTPTLRPEDDYLQAAWQNNVYPLAKKLGLEMTLPGVSPQPHTRLAHESMEFAKEHGQANAYAFALFAAFFQHSEDIGKIEVLSRIAGEIGLDAEACRRGLEERSFRERTQDLLRQARLQMVTAVPTFIIGRQRVTGLYPAEVLAQILDEQTGKES
jgi:predicted DsbA family dithiol-disulfide isomerase